MEKISEIEFRDVEENKEYENIINTVLEECFKTENLTDLNVYMSIILTIPEEIRRINKEFRNIDKETDVLSFPMFEKEELQNISEYIGEIPEVLGDIVVSIERVKQQADEYGHSFERELAYMIVHGFYHIMGEDHIEEDDKVKMRAKEENILNKLNIKR
ncbi:MAG: rRNA maturation RNase YbeY [Clostridia bacterium]|nr:rRNA maturation RNase YbeY [Clostridia bacterium]